MLTVKSDTKYCELVGSRYLFKKWWHGSEFFAGVVDYHFIRLIWVQFKVISAGPLGDVVEFIGVSLYAAALFNPTTTYCLALHTSYLFTNGSHSVVGSVTIT